MACDYYRVLCRDVVIAERMTFETACILVKALLEYFWKDQFCQYTIEKMAEVYPKFIIGPSKNLMIRGKDFYAVWDDEHQLWSTKEESK